MAKKKKQSGIPPTTPPPKAKAALKDLRLPGWLPGILLLVVIVLTTGVRLVHLGYDPPVDVFWSQDLWTDPPQYTSYARNAVLFGDSNPLNENMYLPFRRNSLGLVAFVVMKLVGTGLWQSNLVAVLFNIGTVFLFAGAIGRMGGRFAGIGTALLLGINYLFLTYGRVPFLENAMNFWLAAAVFLLAVSFKNQRWYWPLAAGLACGLATFFGKMIALHALPVLFLVVLFVGWQRAAEHKEKNWFVPAVYLIAGFVIVAAFWYPYVYQNIEGSYFAEKSTGVYGAPEGLLSISGFFNRVFSFGADTRLFIRMPVLAAFGFLGAGFAFLPLARRGKFTDRLKRLNPAYLLCGLWFWVAYLALMPWNYRPLRYETVLLIPLAGAAMLLISDLLRRKKSVSATKEEISIPWSVALGGILFSIPVYHLVTGPLAEVRQGQTEATYAVLAVLFALAGTFVLTITRHSIGATWQRVTSRFRLPELILILAVLTTLVIQGRMIINGWSHGQQAMTSASRTLDEMLGADAVLVGSYATGLTLENNLKNLVYMFGVANVNHMLFRDYPITHLAVIDDKQGRAFTDYPDICATARRVTSCVIGNRAVGIFRVAELSPNQQARQYQPTLYEEAMRCYDLGREDSALIYLDQFAQEYPNNFGVLRFKGLRFMRDSTFDSASYYFGRAVELYPDDYALQYNLGHSLMMWQRESGQVSHFDQAREHFAEVLRLMPNNLAIRAQLAPILSR